MKECLQCKKQFEAKREDTAKFCSANCRVKWNKKNGGKKKKQDTANVTSQVLMNKVLDMLDKVRFIPISSPPDYDGKKLSLHHTQDEPGQWEKPKQKISVWDEPDVSLPTFQDLLNGMANKQFSDEKEEYAVKINAATHLSEKQRNLLLTNLWSKS